MSLDLGQVIGRVVLDTTQFDSAYSRTLGKMRTFGTTAEKSSGGVRVLDRSLLGAAGSADKASASMGRVSQSSARAAAAEEKAAAAARVHTVAMGEVNRVMAETVGMSARQRQAALLLAAAQERVNAAEAGGVATTRQLAGAQAGLIAAMRRVEAAEISMSSRIIATGKTMTRAITMPFLLASGLAIKSAMDFEAATNVYVTAAGESEKNLAAVRDGIKKTAVETGTSIKDLTDAEYLIEKASVHGARGMLILNAAAKGAKEENARLSDVVQAMTSIMASYHLPADRAVQVMNALKTGAGQAKVTMEDYAKALSTVIPIASANKVSVQEVLGAYATLTQHGTSAAEATQELAATIRALVSPNRVAQSQMQQLGLSVVDVTKNIGQRGLTGTIDVLVGAITKHMGKAGLVLQSAFNQSKSAGQDAQIMIEKMPAAVSKLAQSYQAGKISLGDWRLALKALPADQAALARQFQTATDKANGFNSMIRAGDPAAQTFTSALKKVSGGAIGLNTVLQLSGENMAGFKDRTDAVGKSLNDNAKDVEGWASTSKLAATHAAQFKQSLHVLAIDAGANLLPMFDGLVKRLTSAVGWFGHLSSSQKSVVGWSVGILAALGPIMAIGGRLARVGRSMGTFAQTAGTKFATLAGYSEQTATKVGNITRGMVRSVNGILAGAVAGQIGGGGAGGWLTSIMLGTAGGWALGGPIGGAIGAVSAAISKGVGLWGDHKRAAAQAMAAEKQYVDSLTQAINADSGALGRNLRARVATTLQKSGVLDTAQSAGIPLNKIIDASIGGKSNVGSLIRDRMSSLLNSAAAVQSNVAGQRNAVHGYDSIATLVKQLPTLKGYAEGNIPGAKDLFKIATQASNLQKLNRTLGDNASDTKKAVAQYNQLAHALNDGTIAGGTFRRQLSDLSGGITQAVDSNGVLTTVLTGQSVAAKKNRDTLDSLATASRTDAVLTLQSAAKHKDLHEALTVGNARLAQNEKAFRAAALAAGYDSDYVNHLIGKLHKLGAQDVKAKVGIIDRATAEIRRIQAQITGLYGKDLTIRINQINTYGVSQAGAQPGNAHSRHAAGGTVVGPGSDTSDSISVRLSNGEEVIRASQARKHRRLLKAINAGRGGFAAGGTAGFALPLGGLAASYQRRSAVAGSASIGVSDRRISALLAGVAQRPVQVALMLDGRVIAEKIVHPELDEFAAEMRNLLAAGRAGG